MLKIALSFIVAVLASIGCAAQSGSYVFAGSIDESRVEMSLKRDGEAVSGTYWYAKVGKPLKLTGTLRNGELRLVETSPTGAKTGTFVGKWAETDLDGASVTGEWKNRTGTKKLYFTLDQQLIFFKAGERLTTKTFSEINKPKMFQLSAEYPELGGVAPEIAARFNQLAKSKALTELNAFRKDMLEMTAEDIKFARERGISNTAEVSYSVIHADAELISILFSNYSYTGGAHGNAYTFVLNFDLKSGREFELADLFKPDSNFLQVLSDISVKELERSLFDGNEDEWVRTGAGPKAENFGSWNLKRSGLALTFDSYQVAAYAAGPQEVIIPYLKLRSMFSRTYSIFGR